MKKQLMIVAFALMAMAYSQPAHAITYDLTSDHCTGGCGTGPFGTVTVTQNGTSVDIVVDLATGYSFVKTGAADFQWFKFNATGVVLGDITINPIAGTTLAAQTGTFNGDGTGDFTFGITCTTCQNGGSGAVDAILTFHIANATIADVTVPNNLGNIFVADVLAPNGNTGPVDVNHVVPDSGSTLSLLGSVLLGLGMLRMRAGKV